MPQQRYFPQLDGAVGVGAGQPFAVGAKCHPLHTAQRTGLEGRADRLAGDRVPQGRVRDLGVRDGTVKILWGCYALIA